MIPIDEDEDGNLIYEGGIEPIVIRTTERGNFKKCRRLWDYTSRNRRNLEPIRQDMNLTFGISVHKGLEAYYEPDMFHQSLEERENRCIASFEESLSEAKFNESKATNGLSEERLKEYAEHLDLGLGMLYNYFDYAVDADSKIHLTPLSVEEKFQVPVKDVRTGEPLVINGRPVVYQVRLDLVAKHDDGIWIWDHKTTAYIDSNHEFLDLDTQLAAYAWAYQVKYGIKIQGIMYHELAKSYPKEPRVLESGKLSQDKKQNTTYDLYIKKLEELGLDSAPYSAMIQFLATKEQHFFLRTPISKSQQELYNQGLYVCQEIENMMNDPYTYPSPNKMNCKYCTFKSPCNIENEGGDVDFVLGDSSLYKLATH